MTDFPGVKALEVKMNDMVIEMAEQRKESEALRKENKLLIDALKLRDDPVAARACKLRQEAQRTIIKLDSDQRWGRAITSGTRVAKDVCNWQPGAQVFYWRQNC